MAFWAFKWKRCSYFSHFFSFRMKKYFSHFFSLLPFAELCALNNILVTFCLLHGNKEATQRGACVPRLDHLSSHSVLLCKVHQSTDWNCSGIFQIPALSLTSCENLSKLFSFPVPLFPNLWNGNDNFRLHGVSIRIT